MGQYNPNAHNRKSMRLHGYDYSREGLYFITICCQDKACLFGEIVDKEMAFNAAGEMINIEWMELPNRFQNVELHEFVIMPNHFHGIIEITSVGAPLVGALNGHSNNGHSDNLRAGRPQGDAPTVGKTISDMMGAFKSITTDNYIRGVKMQGLQPFNGKMWQRNFYDHIIRNDESYQNIVKYILGNPANWDGDKFHQ